MDRCPFHQLHSTGGQVKIEQEPSVDSKQQQQQQQQACPLGFGVTQQNSSQSINGGGDDDSGSLHRFTCALCQCFLFDAITFFPCGHSACYECVHKHQNMKSANRGGKCPVMASHNSADIVDTVACARCRKAVNDSRRDTFKQHMTDSYMDTEWTSLYAEQHPHLKDDVGNATLINYLASKDKKIADVISSLEAGSVSDECNSVIEMQLSRATYYFREALRSVAPDNPFVHFDAAVARAEKARSEIDLLWKVLSSSELKQEILEIDRREMCNLIGVISGKLAELYRAKGNEQNAREEYKRSCDDLRVMLVFEHDDKIDFAVAQSLSTSLINYGDFSLHVIGDVKTAIKCFEENLKIKERCMEQQQQQEQHLSSLDGVRDLQDSINLIGSILKLVDALQKDDPDSRCQDLVSQALERLQQLESRHGAHLQSPQCHPMIRYQLDQYRQLIDQQNKSILKASD